MTELTTLLQLILLALWCHGWHHLFSPGEALYFISKGAYKDLEVSKEQLELDKREITEWYHDVKEGVTDHRPLLELHNEKMEAAQEKMERKIYFLKPLFLCSICFASVYGTGGYLLLNYTTWGVFPVSIFALISVNKLFQKCL